MWGRAEVRLLFTSVLTGCASYLPQHFLPDFDIPVVPEVP
jgi:hypothetical protein